MSPRRSAARRRSREVALQVLYALDLARGRAPREAPGADETFERVATHFDLPEGARAFAKELVCGVAGAAEHLDELLAEHSEHWRIERMAVVDRNILRLAVFELAHTETPPSVSIDEGVELAKRFGSDSSPAFVNGVLDAVARRLAGEGSR